MRTAIATVALWAMLATASFGQGKRHQVYGPYYNGYGLVPGYSYYEGSDVYSLDYPTQRVWRHYGYQPADSYRYQQYQHRRNAYNGLMQPQPWMFQYRDSYLSPYSNPALYGW